MSEEIIKGNFDKKIFVTPVGSHFKSDIKYKFSESDNCMIPYFEGKYDFYERIQLAKSMCDLDVIIKRAKAGDVSVLHVKNEFYGDVSSMPDNVNDLKALNDKISGDFDNLPADIKKLFNNDLSVFSKAVSEGTFNDTINNYILSLNKKVEDKKVEGDK